MGVNISKIVPKRDLELLAIQGRTIAIDAYNWTYQFLSIIRDRFTGEPLRDSQGRITSHLSGLFYRTARILESGITPVYVWDGRPPDFKKYTVEKRVEQREKAMTRLKEARERGEIEEIRVAAQQAVRLTKDMVEESKKLLEAMGVASIQARGEGEAQCAHMCKSGQVWAVASQDFDSLVFGAPRLIRNLNITGKRKLPGRQVYVDVKPELIELDAVLKELGINQEQLIIIGLLAGGDYNPGGIKGIGPKKALKLVQEKKDLDTILDGLEWPFEVPAKTLFEFYKKPDVENVNIPEPELDLEKLKELLLSHDFSEDRIANTLKKLTGESGKDGGQTGLGRFLK